MVSFGKNAAYQEVRKNWSPNRQVKLVEYLIDRLSGGYIRYSLNKLGYQRQTAAKSLLEKLMANQFLCSPEAVLTIGRLFLNRKQYGEGSLLNWPIKPFIGQLEKRYHDFRPEPEVIALLNDYLDRLENRDYDYENRTRTALRARIIKLLGDAAADNSFSFYPLADGFGLPMNVLIGEHENDGRLSALLLHAATANAGKPTATWLKDGKQLMADFGQEKATAFLRDFLTILETTKPTETAGYAYNYLINKVHQPVVKGLLWLCSQTNLEVFSRTMASVAIIAYKKIPNQGPLDTMIGNACVTALSLTEGIHGISQLAGLSYRIKQSGIREKIDKILADTAAKRGVGRQEIEDLAVQDFGLQGDTLEVNLLEYTAILQLVRPGKTVLTWQNGDKTQKSIPQAVKQDAPDQLKALKATKKALETDSLSLRDRIDWSFRLDRHMKVAYFNELWLTNDLLRYFAERLIWIFSDAEGNGPLTAIMGPYGWENAAGERVVVDEKSQLRLWHPAQATTDEVEQWRQYLQARELTQPLKQAFREVYLLTVAEENTRTYSNRMAAHILKQHQFANLARGRGWSYSLIGAYDHGMPTQACYQELSEIGIRAEYIIQEMQDGVNFNQSGIWNYVSTDQVRFLDLNNNCVPMELTAVPAIVLSEILRDTDLFVGVASIGNDDQWADGGGEVFRNYWHTYSTDALSEVGNNRKLALERLVPRLKIRDVATLDDKFLRVKGKIRTYKIHIGSGNILMEPNDQYLCIVPGTYGKTSGPGDHLYLPFEGDRTLSIILSKALLLAEDDKIMDVTITRQLRR